MNPFSSQIGGWGRLPVELIVVTGITDYPAASLGDRFRTTTHAYLGGIAGVGRQVNPGDIFECILANSGGTHAEAGSYWNKTPNVTNNDDGYRYIGLTSNTIDPADVTWISDGFYNWNGAWYKFENYVPTLIGVIGGVGPVLIDAHAGASPTAAQLAAANNAQMHNLGQTDDITVPIPVAAANMSLLVVFSTAVAKYFRLDPDASQSIYYEGITTGSGKYVGVAATVIGQAIKLESFPVGAGYGWICTSNFSGLVQEA